MRTFVPVYSALAAAALLGAQAAAAADLVIESWRNDDLAIWQDSIIPAFEAKHPDINVTFSPLAPTEYNAALNSKLQAGSAGDLITCRPFDASLSLYDGGHLIDVKDLEGMSSFSDFARAAWSTDDGSATFCMPMASVIHGFIYNREALDELGLTEPATESEFFALLEAVKSDGSYIPMAMGTNDQWEAATMGWHNIGPSYWQGEKGRLGLVDGSIKLTDDHFVAPLRVLAKWGSYLGDGYEAQTYPDSQNLFTLGRAAIYPAGSWEISGFNAQADFAMGAFPPPTAAGASGCYISDHPDIALGINAASPNLAAAKTFLTWMGSAEFADLYSNALPGFFSLSDHQLDLRDPLAQEFIGWRNSCDSSSRPFYQFLSRGTPNLENEGWNAAANVIKGTEAPEAAAARLQEGLASWYGPQQ